jgi:O-antigen/teichoic acid export membrane protein
MTRFQKQAPAIFLSGLVATLLVALWAVPHLGLNGMALSTVVGWSVWNIVGLIFVRRRMRINPTIFQPLRGSY